MIGYRKILIGHFMTFYEILQYPAISFLGYPGCCSLEYLWDRLCQSGTIWDIFRIKCGVWEVMSY